MRLSADVTGLDGWQRELDGMLRRGGSLYPVLRDLADDFLDVERQQFDSEGARASSWKPLSYATIVKRGSAHPILDDGGDLRRSLTVEGAAGQVRRLSATEMVVGTTDRTAIYHQHGTDRMPERPVIDVQPRDRQRWADAVGRYLAP